MNNPQDIIGKREIRYSADYLDRHIAVETKLPKRSNHNGWYKQHGYVKRLTNGHPYSDKRGYVMEHRLIVEENLGKILPKNIQIHHINGVRDDNRLENLQILDARDHAKEHDSGERNDNGQFVAADPKFAELKYRLYNKDTGLTQVYTLQKLTSTTFRRGCFEFRGRFTGLKDKNGKEIFEGDIIKTCIKYNWFNKGTVLVNVYDPTELCFYAQPNLDDFGGKCRLRVTTSKKFQVIGNIFENSELLND
jgi:hypothetical protein